MKKTIFVLRAIPILFFTIFISRSVNAALMPSFYFWGSFDNARVLDRPIPDENLEPEWRDISGLPFSGILTCTDSTQDPIHAYALDMMIPTYTFNAAGGMFYKPSLFGELVEKRGGPLNPEYVLSDTIYNYASSMNATFNHNGTGRMVALIGDLNFIGNFQFDTTFHYSAVPEPSILLLLGPGLVGLGFWSMRKNNKYLTFN